MQTLGTANTSKSKQTQSATNPFARALAETENAAFAGDKAPAERNPLADALARTGGIPSQDFDQKSLQNQQEEAEKLRHKEELKRKLHAEINPIDQRELFNAREKRVKEEIDKVRQELKMLALDVAKFQKEIDMSLMSQVVDPGQDGKYYVTFFQQLRAWIMLLRQKVKSARTWASQMHAKQAKKPKKGSAGMRIGGQGHEKTTTVQKMMHHEQSNAYAGG